MLKLAEGYKVTRNAELHEGYMQLSETNYLANVDVDKTEEVIYHFLKMNKDKQLFFILELPANSEREKTFDSDNLHKDVYYIDLLTFDECASLVEHFGELLINDGISEFGFGCFEDFDEIMIKKYNGVSIYSRNLSNYEGFFEKHNINKEKDILTAWETFSEKTPGEAFRIEVDGITVFDIPELLKDWGIYLAETVEDV